MVSKAEILEGDWQLLRIELAEHGDGERDDIFDGYSRFWCKQAVLGAFWVLEKKEDMTVRLHLTDHIELEGFREALSFTPDRQFKRELLARCNWEEVVSQIFAEEQMRQLSLFKEETDE